MKYIFLLCAAISLAGCSFTPPPMKYMAADMPKSIPVNNLQKTSYIEVVRHKFGLPFRSPQDVGGMVKDLQNKTNTDVLRNADVRIRIPFCLYIVCYAYDTAFSGASK
jgi:hypothetical protein